MLRSGPPWKPLSPLKDTKQCSTQQDPGLPQRRQSGRDQRKVSFQRNCFLGLEVKPELVWDNWDLQGEFTKTLVLWNMKDSRQKLHVRPPVSKFFTTSVPQVIFLSPGISFSTDVTFRPLQRCEYEDSIEFQDINGSFQVCLRATIPCPALEVPDSVLLPTCAVQHSTQTTFLVKNVSKLQTCFQWDCFAPFQLSPEQGLLKPGQECHITVVFRPQEALVYQQRAYCRFGEEEDDTESSCTVLLQGPAKYPHLQLRNLDTNDEKQQCGSVLCFGNVAVDQTLQKHFGIFNPSHVSASFSLSRLSNGGSLMDSRFNFDVTKGMVAPGGLLRVTVTFTPTVVDVVSVDYLSLKCRGAVSESQLKLTGNCVGPEVSLSSSVVDFGCVQQGGTVVQTLELVNSSPVEAVYQWDLDCNGHSVFGIQPAGGTVNPHSQITLRAVYRPTQPLPHHRRVACLILHRDPMFLDLIGTCHSALQKPAILKPEHLVLYKLNWYRRQDPPDTLSTLQQDTEVQLQQQEVLCPPQERQGNAGVVLTPMEEYYQSYLGCKDPLGSSSSSLSPHVSVMPCELLFNHKTSSAMTTSCSSAQSVSITNHTKGKLSLVWTVAQSSSFSVSPSSCDLAPLKATSFRVNYDPRQLNTLHEAQLECFAYYKLKDIVEKQLLDPPWCVTVRVVGHSFQPGKENFTPCCSLQPPQVLFPALSVLSYRTVLFKNNGNLPLTFCLDQTSNPNLTELVSVLPTCGLVQPGNHQILTLRTTPTEESPRQGFSIHLQLNAAKHTKELKVVSVVEKLCVSLEGDGSLYFQPTAVGSQTQRSHHIKNLSLLPIRFQWSIPEPDQDLISVEPDAGELQPNDSSVQMWSFSPQAERTYTLKPTLKFWPIQTPGCNESDLSLNIVGVGSKGFLEAEEAVLEIGEILVGSYCSIQIPLVNRSSCPVSFKLSVQQRLLDEDHVDGPETVPMVFQLERETGTIASHSTILIRSAIRPCQKAKYQWVISYQMLNTSGCVSSPPQDVCEVRAEGVFPTLKVIDVCGGGSVDRLSKVHLWKLFSLDRLNEHLLYNLSLPELTYRTPARHSLAASPSFITETVMDFNFSAAPLNSDPSTFVLIFHNPGTIPVDWAFVFPEDQQIELEYWAQTGEFTRAELHRMKVQDNHPFSISPRSGTLLPGQQKAVHFSDSHNFKGMNQLPVVFKFSYGRDILLKFHGMTVERDRPYLHIPSKHVLQSVAIGEHNPPMQMFELYNCGAVSVRYDVDTAVVSQLQSDNFDRPVLCCLNPNGEVLPGKAVTLNWIFSPLEAKIYQMDIPIYVQGGDCALVRFEGHGFNPHLLGSTNPFNCSAIKTNVQKPALPGQVAVLSEDSVSLGHIPVCSRSSRILFLTNASHTETVQYTWERLEQVQIHPEQGRLHPGERALCVLNFTSTDYPTCYQLDVMCQIVQEAALARYHSALEGWEEKERQQHEFPVTGKNITDSSGVFTDMKPIASLVRKGPPITKYKTLPPILARSYCETVGSPWPTRAERWVQREMAKVCRRPEPPKPALLHLGITAHSHEIQDYITHFPDRFNERYRCFQFVKPQQTEKSPSSMPLPSKLPSPTHGPDRELSKDILTSVLKEIFHDAGFTQSLNTLVYKPNIIPAPTPCSSPPDPTTQIEQHSTVDHWGTAGCSRPQVRSMLYTEHVQVEEIEDVLLKTLQTLMAEVVREELVPPPRTVVLPPASTRGRRKKENI